MSARTTGLDYLHAFAAPYSSDWLHVLPFHPVDYVLTTTILVESLSVLGLAPTYKILMSALVTLPLTVVAHMVYLANEVQTN